MPASPRRWCSIWSSRNPRGSAAARFILYWDAGAKTLASYRRPRDRACRRHARAVPRRARQAAAARRGHGERPFGRRPRRARRAEARARQIRQAALGGAVRSPAITLARDGFPISPRLAKLLADDGPASFTPEARAYFFDAAGRPWPDRLQAQATRRLPTPSRRSPATDLRAFYEGDIARDIAAAVQNDPRKPGKLTAEDLASYRANEREPVCVPYRGFEVCGVGPPSSGGVAVGQVLGADRAVRSRPRPARRRARASHRRGRAARFRRPRPLSRRPGFRRRSRSPACSTAPILPSAAR